jgi:O-antigen/teichoic acid export membrane protein
LSDRAAAITATSITAWRGTTITACTRAIEVLLSYSFYTLLARSTSTGAVGLFGVAVAVLQFASAISRRGLDQAVLASAPAAPVNRFVLKIASTNALVIALVIWFGTTLFSPHRALAPLIFFLPVVTSVQLVIEMLRSRGSLAIAACAENVVQPAAALLLSFIAIASGASLLGFGAAYALSWLFALGFALKVDWKGSDALSSTARAALLSTGNSLLGVQILQQAWGSLDILLIASLAGAMHAGVYWIAFRVAAVFLLLHGAVSAALTPAIRNVIGGDQLAVLFGFATRWATAVALPLASLIVAAPELLLTLFGADFAQRGSVALVLLTVTFATYLCSGPAGSVLLCGGQARRLFQITAGGVAVTFIAIFCLSRHGATGAATAVLIGGLATRVALVASIRRFLSPQFFVWNVLFLATSLAMARSLRFLSLSTANTAVAAVLLALPLAALFLTLHGDVAVLRGAASQRRI